jgi:hypothetical protein
MALVALRAGPCTVNVEDARLRAEMKRIVFAGGLYRKHNLISAELNSEVTGLNSDGPTRYV